MRLHREHKIAIAFALVMGGGYFGYQAFAAYQVDRVEFAKISPGKVNIVGIQAGAGYRIIVANQVAQLMQTDSVDFDAGFSGDESNDTSGGNKRRVPLREMLQSLQGSEEALGKFVTAMNDDLKKLEMPTIEVLWPAAKLDRALKGDPTLLKQLEQDLNIHLDGTPLDQIRPKSMQNGIVIVCPVPVTVAVAGEKRLMKGEVKIPFRPRFVEDVEKRYAQEFTHTNEVIKGNYVAAAKELEERPAEKQNVGQALASIIDPDTLESRYAEAPTRVLSNAFVVITDSYIEKAAFDEVSGAEGKKLYDINVDLTDEGRKRMWQYSRRHQGAQLLLVIDPPGVAVAAPRIRHELAQSTVTIRQIPDRSLVEEAVDLINSVGKKGS